jgi:hypothetical protein
VRVQLDLVSGLAVFIALEGAVCVDRDEANPAACSSLDAIGGTTFDCPSRGYRLFEARPGNARVEIFSPTKPVAGCAVPVVPGTSVGPVHLGMRADALTKCGLGLVGTPNVLVSSSGAYQVELEGSPPGAAFIRLQVTDGLGACVGSTPLAPAVQPGALCASLGFCGCTTSADPIQRGTTIVLCAAQGIEFTFEAGAGLKHLRVLAARPGVK